MNMKLQQPPARKTEPRSDTVQSLSRALSLLNTLSANDQGLALSELARIVALPVSTAHRLLGTLQQDGFVRYDAERGTWLIGVRAFVVGASFLRSRDLTAVARSHMRELMERSGETVNLAIEDDGEVIYVSQIECRQTMRAIARTGGRAAMHSSGMGKAILATLPAARVERILKARGLPRISDRTITDATTLRAELNAIRGDGYALDDEENTRGLRCIAAAIFDEHGEAVGAVSLSGPTFRIERTQMPKLGVAVRETALRITKHYGGMPPR